MRNGILRAVLASIFTITLQLASATANAQANNLIDLGVGTIGHAVNNSGQVALDQGIYSNGTITPLPSVPGGSTPASALAINGSGQVAGTAISPVIAGSDPIAYINGTLIDIGSMILTGVLDQNGGAATGINSSDVVVGWYLSNLIDDTHAAFTYNNGAVTNLPSFPCRTFNPNCGLIDGPLAYGINDSGEIVGSVAYFVGLTSTNYCTFTTDAFSYSNGSWNDFGPGTAYAANASGQVAGTLTIIINSPASALCETIGTDAFLNTSGMTTILGTLPGGTNSIGYAINGTGQVVGSSDFTGSSTTHAFFYNGVMTDLNAIISKTDPLRTSVTLTSAVGINDSRLILANGVDSSTPSLTHAYLLQGPWINVAPATLSFGNEAVGGTSQSQSIVVTNAGSTSMLLGTISASSNFSLQSNGCSTSLAAGAQCMIMAVFAPTVAGALTGNVTVPSSGTNYVVALSGDAPITATLTASKSTASAGTFVTLTWVSAAGSSCTATSGSVASPFNGNIAPSGSMSLTQNIAGTELYEIHCTAPGLPEADSTVMIVWTWPTVTATLSASPSTITAGQSTTLTWTSTNATGCTATAGGSGDNWAGAKATNGSQTITEPFATATASVMLTFGITCSSTASGLSGQATANVTDNSPPPSKSGGGAIDLVSIFALLGIFGLGRRAVKR